MEYRILYKERGKEVQVTTYNGPLTEDEIIEFFGLRNFDVEYYQIDYAVTY